MAAVEDHKPEDEFLIETFIGLLPPAMLLATRAVRSLILFVLTLLLTRAVPSIEFGLTLAFCVAGLSLFNLTKWVATAAIALLLVLAVVPPQIAGKLLF